MHISGEPKCYNITEVKEGIARTKDCNQQWMWKKNWKNGSQTKSHVFDKYKFIDKTLYVGVRYGLFEGDGADFYFKIEGNFSDLENVVLTNDLEERCVWNLHKDKKYMEKINSSSISQKKLIWGNKIIKALIYKVIFSLNIYS